jgi:type VI secretion system protein ImpL
MFAFLKRTIVLIIGLLLLIFVIWFAGPYFAFGDFHPLQPELTRYIVIIALVGGWLLYRLFKRLRAFNKSDRLLTAVVAQPQPQAEKARTPAEVAKLRERFEEAVGALKQQRRTGRSLYDLPWYVIIGAPGSGKTTALLNSGLRFPLEQRVGKGALRGVGGTRNCDWWFTDEAVFLDTAGRYTTQDSDASSDSVGWSEFLTLLKKYRPRRPLNGVIVTVSVQDLLDPSTRDSYIEAARTRLAELHRELNTQLPVYVMVTKCDLVDGFAEYFEDLTAEGRAQVWGVTFPYDKTVSNEAPAAYPAEFDALMTRLNERVFERLEELRDARRRTKTFAFPQQMGTLRELLTQWISEVFGAPEFDGRVLLRGVYFTSGTQEGTPFDRLLGTIGRTFRAADAVMTPRGPGKAYFVEHLLKTVMIGESGLAGVNRKLELRNASLLLGGYIATGLIAALAVIWLTVAYNRNSDFLGRIKKDVDAFEQTPAVTPTSPLEAIVARLDGISAVLDTADRFRNGTSVLARWGLYEGRSIANSARDAYVRELDSVLLPRFGAEIRARLIQSAGDPLTLYRYFKGYLMLGQPEHLDKAFLQTLADQEWKQGRASTAGPAVAHHFSALLENSPSLRALPLDARLVGQTRSSLPRSLMPRIVYDALKRANVDEPGQGLRIDQAAGLDSEKVFSRKSGMPLSTPIPHLYTREQFKEVTTTQRATLMNSLTSDAWVWGGTTVGALASAGVLMNEVTSLYENDYIHTWDALLDDLQFVPFATVPQANEALRIVTAPNSPLRGLLRVIADQTTLVTPTGTVPKGVIEETKKRAEDILSGAIKSGEQALGMSTVAAGTAVTYHYQWARQLTAGEQGKTPLDAIINSIAEIQRQLDTLGPDVAGGSVVAILSSPQFRGLMQTLRQQASALPPGLQTLVSQIADAPERAVIGGATSRIEEIYTAQILPACSSLVANRYPFATSGVDVQLQDFASVFGFDGVFDKFFTEYLEKQVDMTGATWTWRPGSVTPSHRLLEQFQQTRMIRDMFFNPGSKTPEVKYFLTFSDLDSSADRAVLEIDGQIFDDKHAKQPGTWPGPTPGHAASAFEARYFDPKKVKGGPWALFRMIDETRLGPPDAQQRIMLNVQDQFHRVRVTVEAARATGNPFATTAWRQFSCES